MSHLFAIIVLLLNLYLLVLIGYCVLSLIIAYVRLEFDSPVYKVQKVFTALCDPVLNPIRRVIPTARIGNVGLDLSVLVVFIIIDLILIPLFH